MKDKIIIAIVLMPVVIYFTILGGIIYTAWHFISKFW